MNKLQINGRTRQAKGRDISSNLFRDRLLGKKARVQKPSGRIQAGYGDFKDDFQDFNELDPDDDIRGYGDFRDDLLKSG